MSTTPTPEGVPGVKHCYTIGVPRSSLVTVSTNDRGQQNMWAREPQMYIDPTAEQQMKDGIYETHNERAEKLNGRVCMVGFTIGLISYILTGTLGFGFF